jgi:hypothetical protein
MEECQFIVGANWLANQPGRQGVSDICEPFEIGGSSVPEMRKSAWSLRNLAIAALVTPDDDVLKNPSDLLVYIIFVVFTGKVKLKIIKIYS